MIDNSLEIKNEKRANFHYIIWCALIIALTFVFAIIMGSIEKQNYNLDNLVEYTGEVTLIEEQENQTVIYIKDSNQKFTIFAPLEKLISFETLQNKAPAGAILKLQVLKFSLEADKSVVAVFGIETLQETILQAQPAISTMQNYSNDNLIICYIFCAAMTILFITFLIILNKTPKIKKIDFAEAIISPRDILKTPIQKKYEKECLLWSGIVCAGLILVVVLCFVNVNPIIYYVGFPAFFVVAIAWMAFLLKKAKQITKNVQLPAYLNKFDFENKNLSFSRDIFLDLAHWLEFRFSEKGVETVYRFVDGAGAIIELEDLPQEESTEKIEDLPKINVAYDELNLSAKAYFKPHGELISIILKSNLETPLPGLNKDLFFKLDAELYYIIQKFNVGVYGLEESLKNLKTNWETETKKRKT